MIPGGRPLIGYRYNAHTFLSFIVTGNTEIPQEGLTYLSKHPGQFYNVIIRPGAHPLVMYKLFESVNHVDSNKK